MSHYPVYERKPREEFSASSQHILKPQKSSPNWRRMFRAAASVAFLGGAAYYAFDRVKLSQPEQAETQVDTFKPDAACSIHPTNAASKSLISTVMIPPGGIGALIVPSVTLWQETAAKLGIAVPELLNAEYVGRVAELESSSGWLTYQPGNSYTGMFGLSNSLSAETSHVKDKISKIVRMLEAAKSKIPVLKGCKKITEQLVLSDQYFNDPTLQTFILLTVSLDAYNALNKLDTYKTLPDLEKQLLLYVHHNLPAAALTLIKHHDEKKPFIKGLLAEYPTMAKDMMTFVKGNPKIYGKIEITFLDTAKKKHVLKSRTPILTGLTPYDIMTRIAEKSEEGAKQVNAYDPAAEFSPAHDRNALDGFLNRSIKAESRQKAATLNKN